MSEKNVLTFVQTVSQSVPNQPRTVSAREVNVLIQFSKVATTKSQTAPKTSWTPCHTISQSPVKIPAKMSNRPVRISRASLRILLICWNTPSKNRSEQLAEAVPDCLHYFGYVLELEPQRVEPVHNSLPELVELGLDSVPDRCDLIPKFFVVFP